MLEFQVNALELPRITICSSSPDPFDPAQLTEFLKSQFPDNTMEEYKDLVRFIIAGSGFQKMGRVVCKSVVWN